MSEVWILYLIVISSGTDLPILSVPLHSYTDEQECFASRQHSEDYASSAAAAGNDVVMNKLQRWGGATRREFDCLPILVRQDKYEKEFKPRARDGEEKV